MIKSYTTLVIGGGAAGFFAALAAKNKSPSSTVAILEKNKALLSKVKVSGGGRCNVTHFCFDPKELVKNYPRGAKELLGPFYSFGPKDTVAWFEERGVLLKKEDDGRMFPVTDCSQTIIDTLLQEAHKLNVEILTGQKIVELSKDQDLFKVELKDSSKIFAKNLILATGSSSDGHNWIKELSHTLVKPVPSLFTFNVPNSPLSSLSGISVENAEVSILDSPYKQKGPLLITHFGFSGPATLKLSSFAARHLHEKNYQFKISINWLPDLSKGKAYQKLSELKKEAPKKTLLSENSFKLPKNLWKKVLQVLSLDKKRLNDLSLKELSLLCDKLCSDIYSVHGKTTHKEEFVTCGGVLLKEIDFKTMQSKICENLFFAGEILDIDGVTGGFNFQNAWTTGFIAGSSLKFKSI